MRWAEGVLLLVLVVDAQFEKLQDDGTLNFWTTVNPLLGSKALLPSIPDEIQAPPSLPPRCSESDVVYLALLSRHGARNPTSGKMELIEEVVKALKPVASSLPDYMQQWLVDADIWHTRPQGALNDLGRSQLFSWGKMLLSRYGNFLNGTSYSRDNSYVNIWSTWKQRTAESASATMLGWFQGFGSPELGGEVPVAVTTHDELLRCWEDCKAFDSTRKVKGRQARATWDRERLPAALTRLKVALNLPPNSEHATEKLLLALYASCQSESDYSAGTSAPCQVLGPETLRVLSHAEDISDYAVWGPGSDLGPVSTLPVLQHVLTRMESAASSGKPMADLMFSHKELLLPFITLLNIVSQAKPVFDPPGRWRVSQLAPMPGRVEIALLGCGAVRIVLNEHTVASFESVDAFRQHTMGSLDVTELPQRCAEVYEDEGLPNLFVFLGVAVFVVSICGFLSWYVYSIRVSESRSSDDGTTTQESTGTGPGESDDIPLLPVSATERKSSRFRGIATGPS